MGVDLFGDSGATAGYTGTAWDFYLWLADDYGWRRQGTLPPEGVPPPDWDGSYSSCDGQRVTPDDATAMAVALERVLADPAREEAQRRILAKLGQHVRDLALRYGVTLPDEDDDHIASDEDLRTLIRFLRSGGFRIE